MSMRTSGKQPPIAACALDAAVLPAVADLGQRGVPRPDVLFFLGTGVGLLPADLTAAMRVPLARVSGVPKAWHAVLLHAGLFSGVVAWLIEDAAGPPEQGTQAALDEPPWVRGYPCTARLDWRCPRTERAA
jgi:hypothetical protein